MLPCQWAPVVSSAPINILLTHSFQYKLEGMFSVVAIFIFYGKPILCCRIEEVPLFYPYWPIILIHSVTLQTLQIAIFINVLYVGFFLLKIYYCLCWFTREAWSLVGTSIHLYATSAAAVFAVDTDVPISGDENRNLGAILGGLFGGLLALLLLFALIILIVVMCRRRREFASPLLVHYVPHMLTIQGGPNKTGTLCFVRLTS